MKVHLLAPGRVVSHLGYRAETSYLEMMSLADHCREHQLVEEPSNADVVLAPICGDSYGLFFEKLKRNPVYKANRSRLFAYTIDDFQFPALPGIYPAVSPFWASRSWAVGGHYVTNYHTRHQFENLPAEKRDVLFSFVGSSWTHPIREKVMRLKHPRAVLDDSERKGEPVHWWLRGKEHFAGRVALFEQVMSRSKFVLCPRGYAAASMRMFQAMQAGAVPVILADSLVLPIGPDWARFVVRIPERDLAEVPRVLEQLEPNFPAMSLEANRAWANWFSPERTLASMINWCEHLLKTTSAAERRRLERMACLHSWLAPTNVRMRLRRLKRCAVAACRAIQRKATGGRG
jgi:hypothetical protein